MNGELNFSRVAFRNERLARILYGLAALALCATTLWHGIVLTRHLLREREELDAKVQSLEEELSSVEADIERARSELRTQQTDKTSQQIGFLAAVYRRKGFSWTGLFNELEQITPANVRITSISPSEAQGEIEVRLTTVARSLKDLLELVQRLEESRFFGTVMPVDEAHEETGGAVAATVTLRYLAEEKVEENEAPMEETAGY